MYQPASLKWVKNVKREGGIDWAYMEKNTGDHFYLHFPNNPVWYPGNYSTPQPNELILIFQTVNNGLRNSPVTYLTHLVTPVDKEVIDDGDPERPYKRAVAVIAKADPAIIKPMDWSFYKPNRGQICGIDTIEREEGQDYSLEEKQAFFFNLFQNILLTYDDVIEATQTINIEDYPVGFSAQEGLEQFEYKLHLIRERNKGLIRMAKQRATDSNKLLCEVCKFNFADKYPVLGDGFIECHHKLPIATGGVRDTRIEDLALVCANCHRMLHRKYYSQYLTVEELKALFFP
jgi:hypothetical protein